ncbi:MAG TPA: aquaporin [Cyclobacteriaceae bacterium]|nr:aquaporin [Cyclobacteriaceae bacterium]
MKKYLIELIGTFFLVLTIGLTGNPLAIGAMLMVMIYMGGHVSGAHYNPAVTMAILMQKKIDTRDAGMYMIFQIIGSIAAALVVYLVTGNTFAPVPGSTTSVVSALLVEIIFTFALVSVILNVAVSPSVSGNNYYGLAIGFTVLAGAFAGGGISGGAYNPAVGIGPCLIDTLVGGNNSLSTVWLYLVGPPAGAWLGSKVFSFTE